MDIPLDPDGYTSRPQGVALLLLYKTAAHCGAAVLVVHFCTNLFLLLHVLSLVLLSFWEMNNS
jgi:hypothetical protein